MLNLLCDSPNYDWLVSVVIGIGTGIISSVIIFIIMRNIKPKIKISEKISRDCDNGSRHTIKVINLSKCMATNLRYSLKYVHKIGYDKYGVGLIKKDQQIFYYIPHYKKNCTDYAKRIEFDFDEKLYPLNKDSKFVFEFYCEHSFSKSCKYFEQSYKYGDIVTGQFKIGNTTEITSR